MIIQLSEIDIANLILGKNVQIKDDVVIEPPTNLKGDKENDYREV